MSVNSLGLSPDAAAFRIETNDKLNAQLIIESKANATRIIKNDNDVTYTVT